MANRDPKVVGYEWAAWHALQGDEPLEYVALAARELQERLGSVCAGEGANMSIDDRQVVSSAHLFIIAIAELLDPDGRSEFKAVISRRKKGKPIDKSARARTGHKAAAIVERLTKQEGWKQEAALAEATAQTGLSRAEIMTWLRHARETMAMEPGKMAEIFDKQMREYRIERLQDQISKLRGLT